MAIKLTHLQLIYGPAGAREKFEELAVHLIRSERPEVERIRIVRGDGGIDAHEGCLADPAGVDVYQVKFFPEAIGDSQKAQIRDSFTRICTNKDFKAKTWTLCLPIDMSLEEKKWFDEWRANQKDSGIEIRPVWSAVHLEGLLYQEKNSHLREQFFRQGQQQINAAVMIQGPDAIRISGPNAVVLGPNAINIVGPVVTNNPQVKGGDVEVSGPIVAGAGLLGPGGHVKVEGGTGRKGASGGNVRVGPGEVRAGDGGPGGNGGSIVIKGGDAE